MAHQVPPEEAQALRELFASTRGLRWHVSLGWGCGDPCTDMWWGVTCGWANSRPTVVPLPTPHPPCGTWEFTARHVHQVELNLPAHGLNGSLPSSLGVGAVTSACRTH